MHSVFLRNEIITLLMAIVIRIISLQSDEILDRQNGIFQEVITAAVVNCWSVSPSDTIRR